MDFFMFDDEDKKPVPQGFQNLEKLSVDEIEEYIEELKKEISRAENELRKKKDVIAAASSIFG